LPFFLFLSSASPSTLFHRSCDRGRSYGSRSGHRDFSPFFLSFYMMRDEVKRWTTALWKYVVDPPFFFFRLPLSLGVLFGGAAWHDEVGRAIMAGNSDFLFFFFSQVLPDELRTGSRGRNYCVPFFFFFFFFFEPSSPRGIRRVVVNDKKQGQD